jgi:hypothetical protein
MISNAPDGAALVSSNAAVPLHTQIHLKEKLTMTRRFRVVIATLLGAFLAVAALMGAGRLLASTLAVAPAPTIVNYQGFLTDSGGNPISGTATLQFSIWDASSAGNQVWNETHNNVAVAGGFFSVFLGSQGTPLTPSVFSSDSRYLEVTYNGTTFARQRFASVPYALVASEAISATYATTATYVLNGGSGGVEWSHVVVVAKSGGDYTTVTDAMNAITPSSTDRYLVLVMPGVYDEQVELKEYVHLKGAGVKMTYISSAANTNNPNDDAATTMIVPANTQVSDLTVRNTSATNASVGMKVENGNSSTILNNVKVEVITAGGTNRRGMNVSGGNGTPQFTHLHVEVDGATSQNWGVFVSASSPTVHDSKIDVSGTGAYGFRMNGGNPKIDNSVIEATNGSDGEAFNTSGGGTWTIYIDRSSLIGDAGGNSLTSTDNYDFYVATSFLSGPAAFGGTADFICVFNYDAAYTELDANCQ